MNYILILSALVGLSMAAPHAVSPFDLKDDLDDFLKLIPVETLKAIAHDHLLNDGEFQSVVVYLQGEEWAKLVQTVKDLPETQELVKYLIDAGLPVDAIIEFIHNFIHNAKPGNANPDGGNLRGFLDEIERNLPIVDLLALLANKLVTSKDFKALYDRLASEENHQLFEKVRALPEVQRIAKKLIDLGVHVKEALAVVYKFFGWGDISVQSLEDDFKDFLKLIPVETLKAIAHEHLLNDGEFQSVVVYLQGEEWAKLVQTVKDLPETQELVKYLIDAGLPVDAIIEFIHNFIHNAKPGNANPDGGNLRGFLDEIEKNLPVVDLLALLANKLVTSKDFKALYNRLASEENHELIEKVRALPEVQRIAKKLIDLGVHLKEGLAIVYKFFGWADPFVSSDLQNTLLSNYIHGVFVNIL